jgi:ABC-type transporter lipoprotein component MlaA
MNRAALTCFSIAGFGISRLRPWRISWLLWAGMLASCTTVKTPEAQATRRDALVPAFVPDPIEPVNRGLGAVNHGLLVGIIQPTGKVYRAVLPPPARRSISNFTHNLTYPGRLLNNALQGRWSGAGDESLRFVCNTTVGVGGFFDVASRWNIPKSEAGFDQTFSQWGWPRGAYLMLPFYGPSSVRHAFGLVGDEAAAPWNYSYPYMYGSYFAEYNDTIDKADEAVRFVHAEPDAYSEAKYFWTYTSQHMPPDWTVRGPKDEPTVQTIAAAAIACQDPDFPDSGREMKVRLPSTGRDVKFNCWLRPGTAPLVFIVPGLGSHRLSLTTLSLAEHLYRSGYSVVSTCGIFHPEFMENASTAALPAYPPVDCHDVLVELTGIDQLMERKWPGRFGKKALIGFSMGAFQALHLAADEKHADPGLLRFDRYVALNPPVDLRHGAITLNRMMEAPMDWPAGERQARMGNSLQKLLSLDSMPSSASGELPFDGTESRFLTGLTFRLILRDAIYSSQTRNNMGVLHSPLSWWRREPAYDEIFPLDFRDYFQKFVLPYYRQQGLGITDFEREVSLKTRTTSLRSQSKARVVTNRNDFLLAPADIDWLESTFGSQRLKILPSGGHLGNMAGAPVHTAVTDALHGL